MRRLALIAFIVVVAVVVVAAAGVASVRLLSFGGPPERVAVVR